MTHYKAETIVPYNSDEKKSVQVQQMFDSIAPNYDALNHTLSLGIDYHWRKKGILSLKALAPQTILDIATGTGDLALEAYTLLKPKKILGIDISEGMMRVGKQKVTKAGLSEVIEFSKQDCTDLKLETDRFDAAMVAFGIRNFENLDKSLLEILRVLRPGGRLMILELSTPDRFPMKQAYFLYSKVMIPLIGRVISGDKAAYNYLPRSIAVFPQGKQMAEILRKNGFKDVKYKKFTFGVCTMYLGTK